MEKILRVLLALAVLLFLIAVGYYVISISSKPALKQENTILQIDNAGVNEKIFTVKEGYIFFVQPTQTGYNYIKTGEDCHKILSALNSQINDLLKDRQKDNCVKILENREVLEKVAITPKNQRFLTVTGYFRETKKFQNISRFPDAEKYYVLTEVDLVGGTNPCDQSNFQKYCQESATSAGSESSNSVSSLSSSMSSSFNEWGSFGSQSSVSSQSSLISSQTGSQSNSSQTSLTSTVNTSSVGQNQGLVSSRQIPSIEL